MLQKVLILDDCTLFLEELRKTLSLMNYQIFTCSNASSAIDLSLKEKPNIFICDWQLDGANNGLIITEILKCLCDELKTLFVTAYSCLDLKENIKNQKNLFFLEKPFSKKKLLEILTTIENNQYVSDSEFLPIAVFEKTKDGTQAHNRIAKSIGQLEITEKNNYWNELIINSSRYLCYQRKIENRTFAFLIEKQNEMIIKDPRYTYFLTGQNQQKGNKSNRMLVIDNQPSIRNLASEIMYENMVFCHTTDSVDEGLEILCKDKLISAVIIDSSYDTPTIQRLVSVVREKHKKVKIIATFASSIPNLSDFNFDNILSKPFSAKKLVQSFYS